MTSTTNNDFALIIGRTYGPRGRNNSNFTDFVDAVDAAIEKRNIKRAAAFRAAAREAFDNALFAATHKVG